MSCPDRLSAVADLTHKQSKSGDGHNILRMCFTCNKPKTELGGAIHKRTRMWSCAACQPKDNPCSSSV